MTLARLSLAALLCVATLGAALAAGTDSPLADAIESGRRDAALALIAGGADVNAAQADGTTPLHWAAYQLDAELVRALLARGAKAAAQNEFGASPLAEAVKAANAPIVKTLLAAGADANAANADGETALMLAARTG
ncbi:MAG TPA: ankyrin repeat domain-containing protein, partial [Gammaproteobacteria bacterium]|nr:ankyrin repeat domain-containing protein [Gammaproteobacteria bacterium]